MRRLPWIDAARGGALLAMAAYHFTWDLAAFRWIDGAVTASRDFHLLGHAIAASFLFLSGYSLVLARRARAVALWRDPHYWRRWGQVAAAAGAITLVSFQLFPDAPIFFGILHCIALSSLFALPLVEAPVAAILGAAALALAAPGFFAAPVFDAKLFWWTGLSTFQPASQDYRPLLPWLGFLLLGVAAARRPLPARAEREPNRRLIAPFAWLGRHSLAFYLIHQPLLYGALALIGPQATATDEAAFTAQCVAQCYASGASDSLCETSCACVVSRAKAAGHWRALVSGALSDAQKAQTHDDAVACYADSAR
ncbi:hypothetical protein CCR94_20210 [Rhodoblastus sphagnicola]|uniref:Heparan-alpha-glucosaminide N-acetyltransferase catalytic domain-containing protein n=1 Tax=Rhodoblastus sphagnicola TaxID=333368 RepID=A0A2S6MYF8_9HYPH|nr:heparan-alpha-glucosaminide N-acetyltransferase [Rhodoblastus sphagnicola]MBB4199426.1 putative membrane protein [Rhodoblastus sphagnicola]PPQ27398.1 hypothetical protein CCR94_20210 [Rhodoblastus sphagnicola]